MTPLYLKAGLALNKPQWVRLATQTDFSAFNLKQDLAEVWAQRDIELLYLTRSPAVTSNK